MAEKSVDPYWSQTQDNLFATLESASDGLSESEAAQRLQKFGLNALKSREEVTPLKLFLSQFKSPIVLILLFATGVSAVTQEKRRIIMEKRTHITEFISLYNDGIRQFQKVNLAGADLTEINLISANLHQADLREADLKNADLSDADLSEANLKNANLNGAQIARADLRQADLTSAQIRAVITDANLSQANLTGADLAGANLSHAKLSGANMTSASLCGADLSNADLSQANLYNADLTRATLAGAVLTGAKQHGVTLPDGNKKGLMDDLRRFTQAADQKR